MKNLIVKIMLLACLVNFSGCYNSEDPANWSNEKIDAWFEKSDWLNGWNVTPDASINRRAFVDSYYKNRERWDKAFLFLKEKELSRLELTRYDLDGDNLFAVVSEYLTRNEEDTRFESHRQYIDIQYVINGSENIGLAPLSVMDEILEPYDGLKDIEFFTVTNESNVSATPDKFFIFFPTDAHRPGLKDVDNLKVKKIVVKVKVD